MKNINAMNFSTTFLDFDGVVVESTKIKENAFAKLFENHGKDIQQEAVKYHLQHQGVVRTEKFRAIYQKFLNKTIDNSTLQELSELFSELVLEEILICPLVFGIQEFLEKCNERNHQLYLISGTPDNELELIVQKRGLKKYFSGVFGGSRMKAEIGEKILKDKKLNRRQVRFIGDSLEDYNAASKLDVQFIGRLVEGLRNPFPKTVSTINNFINFT